MGVTINRKPDALVRKVQGKYASPEDLKLNRLVRQFRKLNRDELLASRDQAGLGSPERTAAVQVLEEWRQLDHGAAVAENLAEGLKEVPLKAEPSKGWLFEIKSPKGWLFDTITQTLDSHHGDHGPSNGGVQKVATFRLKLGSRTLEIPIGGMQAVSKEVLPDDFQILANDFMSGNIQVHTKMEHSYTATAVDPVDVAKMLGWTAKCEVWGCQNVEHYGPVNNGLY